MPLGWVLALSDAAAPLVQSVGIYGCVAYATAIAFLCAWLIVGFIAELRKHDVREAHTGFTETTNPHL